MAYVSMKEGCLFGLVRFCFVLFCLYLSDPLNKDGSDRVLGLFVKLFDEESGASAWFHMVFVLCGVEVLEYRMISSLKIKLN